MKNTLFTATKATVRATAYVPFPALVNARETTLANNGKIGSTAEGLFKADFSTAKIAKLVADKLNADYANAKNAKAPAPVSAPTPAKGKAKSITVTDENGNKYTVKATDLAPVAPVKASPRKSTKAPKHTKGNAFDFGKIKGKTNTDKNKALHAELVRMGMKDSRTPEYMSIWNARPWAK